MLGVPGTGPYGRLRDLENEIRADRQYLAAAPLGPMQKKRLERSIAETAEKLRVLRAEIRATKKQPLAQ